MNNVECYVCHNLGHVAARCRSRMVQDGHIGRSSRSKYLRDIVLLAICMVTKLLIATEGI